MTSPNRSPSMSLRHAGLIVLLALVSACGGKSDVATTPMVVEGAAAAIVNDDKIYVSDVELEAVARGLVAAGEPFDPSHPDYREVLNQLIEQKLMAQEAIARKLDEDPAAQRRLQMARERILGNLLVENLVANEVTEANIDEMYEEQVNLQQSNDEVAIAHILVETEAAAQELRDRIEAGESFESLVFNNSQDTATRMENGDLGYISPNEQKEPFPQIIAQTKLGEVSPPFQSADGWHILKVKDRRTRPPKSRDEMRPEIVTFLTLREISRILRRLRTEATIQQGVPGADVDALNPIELPAGEIPSLAGEEL